MYWCLGRSGLVGTGLFVVLAALTPAPHHPSTIRWMGNGCSFCRWIHLRQSNRACLALNSKRAFKMAFGSPAARPLLNISQWCSQETEEPWQPLLSDPKNSFRGFNKAASYKVVIPPGPQQIYLRRKERMKGGEGEKEREGKKGKEEKDGWWLFPHQSVLYSTEMKINVSFSGSLFTLSGWGRPMTGLKSYRGTPVTHHPLITVREAQMETERGRERDGERWRESEGERERERGRKGREEKYNT